ncbi:MAG: hypothetical protein ACLQQ4_15170 [Bacteroidia bacterium]
MSAIEKAIVDVISSAKNYLRTFVALLFRPVKVFNSLDPEFNSSEKYFSPLAFFVIATFLSFVLTVDRHYNILKLTDISSLAQMLPSFAHDMSFLDFLIDTAPIILVSYGAIVLLSKILFIPSRWKRTYVDYAFYYFALAQLLIFLGLTVIFIVQKAQMPIQPKGIKDTTTVYTALGFIGFLMIFLPYLLAFFLPFIPIAKCFNNQMNLFWRFISVPILIPFFYIFSYYTNDALASYRDISHPKEDIEYSFANLSPDSKHIEIGYTYRNDSALLSLEVMYYNPTKQIYFLPNMVCFYYHFNSIPTFTRILTFNGPASDKDTDRYNQVFKPNDTRAITYTCNCTKAKLLQLIRFQKDTSDNFSLMLNYSNFKGGNLYQNGLYKPYFYEKLSRDSLARIISAFKDTLIKRHLYNNKPDTTY